jgi:serine/threonine protein kinase
VSIELGGRLQQALGDAYTIQRELGAGGMATVFLAREKQHDRLVAIKVLRPEKAATLGTQRFRHEISVTARLEHPHILPVHDHGETPDGLLWYSMPYVQGETLRERLKRDAQLPLADAIRIAREVASALHYAHGAGFMHRDVKPDNIMVTAEHEALLADFGIARPLSGAEDEAPAPEPRIALATTTTGFVVGSPQYMSPEQVGGDLSLDARTDQYSLGTVRYEMLAGETPFGGRSAGAVVTKMFAGTAPSVRAVRPDVPVAVDGAITRALARSRGDRFGSISEFADSLHIGSNGGRGGGIAGVLGRVVKGLRGGRRDD